MNKQRPVYLSLTEFGWPITAIASILHRVTGVILFVGIAYLLWMLDLALRTAAGFADAQAVMSEPLPKLVMLAVLALLTYHVVAGIKHMLLDFHVGDSFEAASASSVAVFIISALLTVALGIWLW